MSSSSYLPNGIELPLPFGGQLEMIGAQVPMLLLALLLGWVVARAMRRHGLHWSWAALAAALFVLSRRVLGSWSLPLLVASGGALVRGRRWHREDIDAGADLARAARMRHSPAGALEQAVNTLRLRAGDPRRWDRPGRLVLGRAARGRLVTIPFGGTRGGTHTLLVGATGSGKTVTQTWIAMSAIQRGMAAVVIDPKGDPAMRAALVRTARRCERRFVEWTPSGPCSYNPFARGSTSEVADKVLAGERFTEPHYLRQAQRFLGHVVRALRAAGVETSLASIAQALDPTRLEMLAREMPEQGAREVHAYLDSLTPRQLADVAGVRDRLSILVESDVAPWLRSDEGRGACFDLLEAVRARAIVYFDLDADRRPLLTQMLGAAIVQDLQTTVASLQARPTPTVVVIDEFSALAAAQVVRLFGRARSAAFSLVLGTQELSDLRLPGREELLEQVLGNLAVLIAHRQVVPSSAELVCSLAGSRGAWRTSRLGDGRITRSRTREGVLQVEDVMGLSPGHAAAIAFGENPSTELVQVFAQAEEVPDVG